MKGSQRSKKISSFCLRITLGIWISISANVFLCSAPRPSSCYSATSRLTLAPQERSQQTDSSASSSATGWESLSKHGQRGQGRPPVLTLPTPGLWATTLTFCTSYLCSHGREKAIRTNADEEHGLKTSRKKPFPQVLPSASHRPWYKQLHKNSIYSETTGLWNWWKGSCGSSYETEIGPSVTDILFFSFPESASLISSISSLKAQPCYSSSYQTALRGRFHFVCDNKRADFRKSTFNSAFQMEFPDSALVRKDLEKSSRKESRRCSCPPPAHCTLKYACHLQGFIIALLVLCMYRLKLLLHLRKIKLLASM